MERFQICGNFCSSWILFSPSLKQVQFLPIPSTGQKSWFSRWLQRAVKQSAQWLSSASFSQETWLLSSTQKLFSLLSQEFKPLVKIVQISQIKSAVRREHGWKRIMERKGRWSTWMTYSLPHHTQPFYHATPLTLDKNPTMQLFSIQISVPHFC